VSGRRTLAQAYLPAAFWAAAVFVIGGLSHVSVPVASGITGIDKVGHFGMYGLLGALLAWGWLRAGRRPAAFWLILAALALGAADELRQGLLETRSAEFADWVADALGVLTGFGVVNLLFGSKGKKSE
jgi:VanZ family protein